MNYKRKINVSDPLSRHAVQFKREITLTNVVCEQMHLARVRKDKPDLPAALVLDVRLELQERRHVIRVVDFNH